jgi:hypothetical protein
MTGFKRLELADRARRAANELIVIAAELQHHGEERLAAEERAAGKVARGVADELEGMIPER